MSKEFLDWQLEHITDSKKAIETYDLGAAARRASELGRPLSNAEMETFRRDIRTTKIPHKKLSFDGTRYLAI